MGGMASATNGLKEFFEPVMKDLGGKYFDIFDYHCYGDKDGWKKCGDLVLEIKKVFSDYDFDIWLTETGTFSGGEKISKKPNRKRTSIGRCKILCLSIVKKREKGFLGMGNFGRIRGRWRHFV